MSAEVETETTEEEHAPTLTEAVAAMTPEERGDDETPAEEPRAEAEKPDAGRYQATGRRGARELRKLERARKELDERAKSLTLAEQERAELKEKRELEQLRKDDPAAYAERVGLDVDKMTTTWLEKSKPESKLTDLEKRLDAEKAEREAEKVAREQGSVKARIATAEKLFAETLAEKAEDYPAIADMDPGELFAGGPTGHGVAYVVSREIKAEMDRLGYPADKYPTDEQILKELNAREEAKIAKRAERLGYRRETEPKRTVAPTARAVAGLERLGKTIQGSATRQRAALPPPETDFARNMTSGDRANAIAEELAKEMRRAAR